MPLYYSTQSASIRFPAQCLFSKQDGGLQPQFFPGAKICQLAAQLEFEYIVSGKAGTMASIDWYSQIAKIRSRLPDGIQLFRMIWAFLLQVQSPDESGGKCSKNRLVSLQNIYHTPMRAAA